MTTDPSALSAAKADPVATISTTPVIGLAGKLPPLLLSPQAMTEPSVLRAAKAFCVEKIFDTPLLKPLTPVLPPPLEALPQVTTDPVVVRAANADVVE